MGSFDKVRVLRYPEDSWEYQVGQLALSAQSGRAHVALAFSTDHGGAPRPARVAMALFEDFVAASGGEANLDIAALPGVRKIPISPIVFKGLAMSYEIVSRTDTTFLPKVAAALRDFLLVADARDKDVPAARAYIQANTPRQ